MSASYRRTLRRGDFVRLLAGHGAATLGQLQLTMAVGVHVLDRTGSGVWMSAAVSLGFLPYVLFSAPAGILADRHRRSTILRLSVGTRLATGTAATAGLLADWSVVVVVALAALTAVLATPAYPALAAATAETVDDEDLPAANSLATGVENACWAAGPGLLGLVLMTGAPVAGGGVAAAGCFGVGLLCLAGVRTPAPHRAPGSEALRDEALGGLRAIRSDRRIVATLTLATIDNFLYGYLVVALVLLADRTFAAGSTGVGAVNTALAAGAFTSMLVAPRLGNRGRETRALVIGLGLFSACAALAGLVASFGIVLLVVFVAGIVTLVVEILAVTHILRLSDPQVTARVFGIYDTLAVGVIALGSAVARGLCDAIGVREALVAAAVATLVATAAAVPGLGAAVDRVADPEVEPAADEA